MLHSHGLYVSNKLTTKFRLLVAAMHFNENYGRAQALTKSGSERIRVVFPKQKHGEFTPKIVPVAKTYSKKFRYLLL